MAREDFQGQTGGGGIVDFDFVVTDAWFGTSEAFEKAVPGANQIFMHWVGKTDIEDRPVLDEAGFHPSWKLGPDWEVVDGGKSVKYVGSGKPRFGKSYGRLCDEVIDITENIADTPEDPLGGDNHPRHAATWIGTKWHVDEKHYEFGSGMTSDELQPTAYLGREDITNPTATPSAAPTAAGPAPSNGAPGELVSQVENLARSLNDYQAFQSAALQIPGVAAHSDLVTDIANPDGLFARVNS